MQRDDVYRFVIEHPLVQGLYDDRGSIQEPRLGLIRQMARRLFTRARGAAAGLRHDAARRHRRDADAGVVEHVRDPADPEADAEAHAEADPQAHAQAHGEAHRERRPRPRTPAPTPTEAPTPTPTP